MCVYTHLHTDVLKGNFNKDALNESEVTVKTFIMLQKISVSNKRCSFELSIHL